MENECPRGRNNPTGAVGVRADPLLGLDVAGEVTGNPTDFLVGVVVGDAGLSGEDTRTVEADSAERLWWGSDGGTGADEALLFETALLRITDMAG